MPASHQPFRADRRPEALTGGHIVPVSERLRTDLRSEYPQGLDVVPRAGNPIEPQDSRAPRRAGNSHRKLDVLP